MHQKNLTQYIQSGIGMQWYASVFPMRSFNWCAPETWGSYPSIWDLKGFSFICIIFQLLGGVFFWSFPPWKCEKKLATSPPVSSSIPSGHRQFFTKCLMSKWAVPLRAPSSLFPSCKVANSPFPLLGKLLLAHIKGEQSLGDWRNIDCMAELTRAKITYTAERREAHSKLTLYL